MWQVASFYKFTPLSDLTALRTTWQDLFETHSLAGTLLLSQEGINGSLCGTEEAIATCISHLRADPRFSDLVFKQSKSPQPAFRKLKVLIKKEIVTLGMPEVNPAHLSGTRIAPQDWNAVMTDSDVFILDTRNRYEHALGTFKGASHPNTRQFRDFPIYAQRHLQDMRRRPIAMFCTGGIRCEKASAYLLQQGFQKVYQLEGGILNYFESVPEETSLWQGACFIFDERGALSPHHVIKSTSS